MQAGKISSLQQRTRASLDHACQSRSQPTEGGRAVVRHWLHKPPRRKAPSMDGDDHDAGEDEDRYIELDHDGAPHKGMM